MLEESSDEDPMRVKRRQAGPFEKRVVGESQSELKKEVSAVIKKTIGWPSASQTMKGLVTGGVRRTWKYLMEKYQKYREGQKAEKEREKVKGKKGNKEQKMPKDGIEKDV